MTIRGTTRARPPTKSPATLVDIMAELQHIRNIKKLLSDTILQIEKTLKETERKAAARITAIKIDHTGPPGKDAPSVNEEVLAQRVLALIPKPKDGQTPEIDYQLIIKEVSKLIPKPQDGAPGKDAPALKDILDYLKSNLKLEHVPGLRQELDLYRNQVASKIYGRDTAIRGGGDTVAAGANVTITMNNGVKTISATGSGGTKVRDEVPTGSGTTFTLAHTPLSGTLQLFRGGARQQAGAGKDYTISGVTITLATSLASSEVLLADYEY